MAAVGFRRQCPALSRRPPQSGLPWPRSPPTGSPEAVARLRLPQNLYNRPLETRAGVRPDRELAPDGDRMNRLLEATTTTKVAHAEPPRRHHHDLGALGASLREQPQIGMVSGSQSGPL